MNHRDDPLQYPRSTKDSKQISIIGAPESDYNQIKNENNN